MFNKFYKLDFGLQMIITCLVLFFSKQLVSHTLSVVLTFILFLLQTISIYLGAMGIINYIKQTKTKNKDEQSN